ncbi:MAG: CpsD/CapB family tyrosine-protein kinase [Blastocatellia bacterium]|nr:CpsD/CapB family tyrosine-protein kinase [Blastocatellia bacterium]
MGKVYEAFNRAADEKEQAQGALVQDDDLEEKSLPFEEKSLPFEVEVLPPEEFDFMSYSLRAPSILEKERMNREAAGSALVRRSLARPVREARVDSRRVDPHLIAFYNPDPQVSRQYDRLALSMISKAATEERNLYAKFKRVLVASAQHGDGRTSVTLNLACALARARKRVLVVDCDLMKPSVLGALGLGCDVGLAEAFLSNLPPGEAAIKILPCGFNVLPATRPLENSAALFAAPGFWKMVEAFDPDHDFLLFDSSPLLSNGDAGLLARHTDTTLLVVRAGKTRSDEMAKAIAPFNQEDLFGVVLNRAIQ